MLKKFFSPIFLPLYILYPRDQDHPEMTNDKNDTWHAARRSEGLLLYIYKYIYNKRNLKCVKCCV
jgi:hypothetical protein